MESAPRLRYAVNCSILFTELPLLERPSEFDDVRDPVPTASALWD